MILLAACGGGDDTGDSASTTSIADGTTAGSNTASSVDVDLEFAVADWGVSPDRSLGPSQALGSGCSPDSDLLPDGVWYGWVTSFGAEQVDFDLACLWPGELEPAASNDATRFRRIPITPTSAIYSGDADPEPYDEWLSGTTETPADNAPGLPKTLPFWLFVNGGVATELIQYAEPIHWARSAGGWAGLAPGCCDQGDIAPSSPDDPWPDDGWPADGYYATVVEGGSESGYDLALAKWLSCRDNPVICPDWWVGDEVITDPEQPVLRRKLPFDETVTVVIMPIAADAAVVGDGTAFGRLLADLGPGVEGPDGYRPAYHAPGGGHLTDPSNGWTALEIRDGRPILYIHAGLIAG